jgi:hypothetical protein
MFHLYMFLFSALLFFALTPGILLSLPPDSSKYVVALVHSIVFATVLSMAIKFGLRAS